MAVGFVSSIAVTMISWAFGAGGDPRVGLVLLTLTAIVVGAVTTVPGAIGAGAMCWAFYSGFVLDRFGTLTFERGGGEALLTILLFAVAASVAVGLTQWARAVAAERPRLVDIRLPEQRPALGHRDVKGAIVRWR